MINMGMLHEATKGAVFLGKLRRNGSSLVITLPEAALKYIDAEEGTEMAIVCEASPKYGNYLGVGPHKKGEQNGNNQK